MAQIEFTKAQIAKAKSYLQELHRTDSDMMNTISVNNAGLFVHPYETDKLFIKYEYDSGSSQGGYITEHISVCVTKEGLIDDCFADAGLRERVQFESQLVPLKFEGNEITMV